MNMQIGYRLMVHSPVTQSLGKDQQPQYHVGAFSGFIVDQLIIKFTHFDKIFMSTEKKSQPQNRLVNTLFVLFSMIAWEAVFQIALKDCSKTC